MVEGRLDHITFYTDADQPGSQIKTLLKNHNNTLKPDFRATTQVGIVWWSSPTRPRRPPAPDAS